MFQVHVPQIHVPQVLIPRYSHPREQESLSLAQMQHPPTGPSAVTFCGTVKHHTTLLLYIHYVRASVARCWQSGLCLLHRATECCHNNSLAFRPDSFWEQERDQSLQGGHISSRLACIPAHTPCNTINSAWPRSLFLGHRRGMGCFHSLGLLAMFS